MNYVSPNAKKHSTKNPIKRRLLENFYKSVKEKFIALNSKNILDAGCGEAVLTKILVEALPNSEIIGIDISDEALKIAKTECPQITFKKESVCELPFDDNNFDLVVCSEVLEHIPDPTLALQELKRVTSDKILITVPNEPWFRLMNFCALNHFKDFGNAPGHINHWSISSFKKLIEPHFKIISIESSLPWIVVLAEKV